MTASDAWLDGGDLVRRAEASGAAAKIVAQFPNARPKPEYLAALTDALAHYPVEVIKRLADPHDGIAGALDRLPTNKQLIELATKFEAQHYETLRRANQVRRMQPTEYVPLPMFIPYPALWEQLDEEIRDAIRRRRPTFEQWTHADKIRAVGSIFEARDFLARVVA